MSTSGGCTPAFVRLVSNHAPMVTRLRRTLAGLLLGFAGAWMPTVTLGQQCKQVLAVFRSRAPRGVSAAPALVEIVHRGSSVPRFQPNRRCVGRAVARFLACLRLRPYGTLLVLGALCLWPRLVVAQERAYTVEPFLGA